MKKLILIILAIHCSLFTIHSIAQPCLPEGIIFSTQAQIDNFQINYPGCTEIEGSVFIYGNNISNLNGLISLTSIGGELGIGFDTIHGGGGNPLLTNIDGLGNITTISGNINFYFNGALTDLTGFENLTIVGGGLSFMGSSSLTSLTGLESLTDIGGDLQFTYNQSLTDIIGLDNLTVIGDNLIIDENESLTSLSGLDNLNFIGRDIDIRNNNALTSLTGLEGISAASINNIYIHDNAVLANCEVENICLYLMSPNGSVNIYNNATGCNNPAEVANNCGYTLPCLPFGNYIFFTQADIDNFENNYPDCTELEGTTEISGSGILNLNGLNQLTSIRGELRITGTESLVNLAGLENIETIGELFYIDNNDALTSLSGLESLKSIEGTLQIGGMWFGLGSNSNPSLTSLTGLNNLETIGGDLLIASNSALSSLEGLDNMNANSITKLAILFNNSLSTCDISSICDYLTSPNAMVEIHDNATGCNSQEEVEEACAQSVDEVSVISNLSIQPNPFTNSITIEFELRQPEIVTITIYNHLGKQAEVIKKNQSQGKQEIIWNAENLPAGVYFCAIKTNYGIQTKKMIKL